MDVFPSAGLVGREGAHNVSPHKVKCVVDMIVCLGIFLIFHCVQVWHLCTTFIDLCTREIERHRGHMGLCLWISHLFAHELWFGPLNMWMVLVHLTAV